MSHRGAKRSFSGASRREDRARILDADQIVGGDASPAALVQIAHALFELLRCDVVQKLLADAEWTAGERDFDFALLLNVGACCLNRPVTCPGSPAPRWWRPRALPALATRPPAPPRRRAVADQDRGA